MSDTFQLNDAALSTATAALTNAASAMRQENASRPSGGWESLTQIGVEVHTYLHGLALARSTLADAAHTGGVMIAELVSASMEMDRFVAASLPHVSAHASPPRAAR